MQRQLVCLLLHNQSNHNICMSNSHPNTLTVKEPSSPENRTREAIERPLWRILPAVTLFFLAPLIAEFLLGNLPINLLPALLVLAPMYGGGALLIREVVRRQGRGWTSIFLLGLVYGIFEEAFTTQTLFNPDYLHLGLRLLEPANVPMLGIGAWWTVFVLTLHTVWSTATSIALAEALVPNRATAPWLGRAGLAITGVLFAFGAIMVTLMTFRTDRYVASVPQFAGAGLVCILLTLLAFRLPGQITSGEPGWVPSPRLLGIGAMAAGSCFLLIPQHWGWWAFASILALEFTVIATVAIWSRRAGWDARHRLALAGGAALAYAWHAFPQRPVMNPGQTIDLIGNTVFALGALVLIGIAARRTAGAAS